MDANGSNQLQLTSNADQNNGNPNWSPDGSRIAFASNRDNPDVGIYEIYTMDTNGNNATRLTNNGANDYAPSWSPDGNKIAFTSDRDGNSEIYIMNADGSNQTNMTNSPSDDLFPDWQRQPAVTYSAVVQPPINANGSSVFNAKRGVIPVKFTVTANGSPTCQLPPATISLSRTAGGTLGAINESDFLQPSDSGSNFRISSCQYVYNLGSSSLGVGTYLVQININDMAVGSGAFSLK